MQKKIQKQKYVTFINISIHNINTCVCTKNAYPHVPTQFNSLPYRELFTKRTSVTSKGLKNTFPLRFAQTPFRGLFAIDRYCMPTVWWVEVKAVGQLTYLSSFEIHAPAFSSVRLVLTAASAVPLKNKIK